MKLGGEGSVVPIAMCCTWVARSGEVTQKTAAAMVSDVEAC